MTTWQRVWTVLGLAWLVQATLWAIAAEGLGNSGLLVFTVISVALAGICRWRYWALRPSITLIGTAPIVLPVSTISVDDLDGVVEFRVALSSGQIEWFRTWWASHRQGIGALVDGERIPGAPYGARWRAIHRDRD